MTDAQVLVLLAARLRSRAPANAIGVTFAMLGGDPPGFSALLAESERLGQVRCRGDDERWSLTAAGTAELAAHLGAETERVGRADLVTAYEAFLPLNREFLAELAGDASPTSLATLVRRLDPILAALSAALPRFDRYAERFVDALRSAADDPRWLAAPSLDSVHTIWFELHEHLLATLGRSRVDER
ncbi:MAG: hypothetical protein R2707_08490 [Acidimicrobiales bacterium]